jgi:hypothetical protein
MRHAVAVLILGASLTLARADGLKTINNPGGGQIVYGTVTEASSLQGAMGYALRNIHGHFGDRPQVGRFFQARDSQSVATFFTLDAKQADGGTRPLSGLVIVSMPPGSQPVAAVMYDDSARFAKTGPVMMRKLNEAWRADAAMHGDGGGSSAAPARRGAARPLHMATAGDRSAAIGLADGWRLNNVAGGMLIAEGPSGELISLGVMFQQIRDQGVSFGGGFVCPRSGDLFRCFVSVSNQARRNRHFPEASYRLVSVQELQRSRYEARAIQAMIEVDFHDGKGLRKGSVRVGAAVTPGLPTWAMTVSGSSAPLAVAEREGPTMMAMIKSYSEDTRVIAQETNAVIDRIHATSRNAQIRADAQSAVNDSRNRAFDAHMDNLDRYSKSFQNYQLDRSQVQDNDLHARGTAGNATADGLVKIDPNRFQIVPTQDFIKGVDY